ncbi:MAG: hypothetical protein HOE11_00540 [Candidatus Diapherotrites archaeon]|jgi:hypothetical protein|nr:hypothetical protein [Candidatus Diapherotrites archaeon]
MRAQTSIETMIILAITLIMLIILFSIAWEQVTSDYILQQEKIGSRSLELLKNEIHDAYFLGAGTTKEIALTFPENIDYNASSISGNSLRLKVGENDIIITTDVPIRGNWPSSSGQWLIKIVSFGDFVSVSTDLLFFSPTQINRSINQGSSDSQVLTITNLSSSSAAYTFSIDSPSSGLTISSSDIGVVNFAASDSNTVTVNFNCSTTASGDYNGLLTFASGVDVTYPIFVTCLSAQKRLSLFPEDKNIVTTAGVDVNSTMTVCNNSTINFPSSTTTILGTARDYISSDFTSAISANTCTTLDLVVDTPAQGSYTGTIKVTASGFSDTSDLNLQVGATAAPSATTYWFMSVNDRDLNHWFDYNGFVFQRVSDSAWIPNGELNWNTSAIADNNSWKDANLVAYYKFNETSGSKAADTANQHDGTLTNGGFSESGMWKTYALDLSSTGNYVSLDDNSDFTFGDGTNDTPFSISAWLYADSVNVSTGNWIINKRATSNDEWQLLLWGGKLRVSMHSGGVGAVNIAAYGPTMPIDEWTHMVMIYDGSKSESGIEFYVNGNLATVSQDTTGSYVAMSDGTSPVHIGKAGWENNRYWDGLIDELKIWDKNLSQIEVTADYNSFLNAKFVDENIVDAGASASWNSIKINKDLLFDFGKELRLNHSPDQNQIDENHFLWDDNLVGVWHLNETSGTTFYDSKDNNDGTGTAFDGDEYTAGRWDTNAIFYEGVNDTIDLPIGFMFNLPRQFSLSAWVRINSYTDLLTIFGKQNRGAQYVFDWLYVNASGAPGMALQDGGIMSGNAVNFACSNTILDENMWYHLTYTFSYPGEGKIYVNGSLACSQTAAGHLDDLGGTNWHIGSGNNRDYFNGKIEEVLFFDDELTVGEISKLYASQAEGYFDEGLIGLWHLNETSGTNLVDSSGNDNNATLVGSSGYTTGLWDTNAILLDGVNDYISVGDDASLEPLSVSLSAWFYPTQLQPTDTHYVRLVKKAYDMSVSSPYVSYGLVFNAAGDKIEAVISEGAPDGTPDTSFDVNSWNHVVMTHDGATLKIYRNGSLVESTSKGAIQYSDGNFLFGQSYGTNLGRFKGKIEEVAAWGRSLTAAEITDLYIKGVNRLDLNVYSCSSSGCTEQNRTSSQYSSMVGNNVLIDISSLSDSQYLGFDILFKQTSGLDDRNAMTFLDSAYLADVNISYSTS